MDTAIDKIREEQKASWDHFSPGWKKWDDLTMNFLRPYGDAIIHYLELQPGHQVLDIAAGTGEPGLTIASMVPEGNVVINDLSEGMLNVAREKVSQRKLGNVAFSIADVCDLPFDDNSFDAISCRFGLMFFPDMQLAINEMARVLKPGGKMATSVWGVPENNYWVTSIVQNINKFIEMPPPPDGAPGMFRCAERGLISGMFKNAGLVDVVEEEVTSIISCESAEYYWDFMTEIAAPFVAALSKADAQTVSKIKQAVVSALNERYPDAMNLDTYGLVIGGRKA